MSDPRTLEELKDRGAGRPAPDEVRRLYHQAFDEYRTAYLWSRRELDEPTIAQAISVAETLRVEGTLASRALAVRIEQACRASL